MPDRPTRPFSRDLAAALRGYMRERGISQLNLAGYLDRSPGYISEHLSGHRAVDTDMLDAVADLADIDTRRLLDILNRRMGEAPAQRDDVAATVDRIMSEAERVTAEDPGAEDANEADEHRRHG